MKRWGWSISRSFDHEERLWKTLANAEVISEGHWKFLTL